jgi:hypothetical protein
MLSDASTHNYGTVLVCLLLHHCGYLIPLSFLRWSVVPVEKIHCLPQPLKTMNDHKKDVEIANDNTVVEEEDGEEVVEQDVEEEEEGGEDEVSKKKKKKKVSFLLQKQSSLRCCCKRY